MTLSYALLFLCFAHISPIFALQGGKCSPKTEVVAELEKRYNLEISEANVTIKYDFDDTNIADVTYESVDLLLNTANIIFKGLIKSKSLTGDNEKTSINFYSKPILVRRVQPKKDAKYNCTLVSSQNFEISMGLPEDIEAVIIDLTEHCLQTHVCEKFESIVSNSFLQMQRFQELYEAPRRAAKLATSAANHHSSQVYADVGKGPACTAHHDAAYNPQGTINAMVDFGINVLINKIATGGDSIVKIPDIHYETSKGATFEINAYNGTFKHLKTLNRVKDVVFTHNNLKFNVGSTFRLDKAEINFDYYKIRYGKAYVAGHLHVLVDGITLALNASLDYNEHPCHIYLPELTIGEIGKIDVNLTGFGIVNKPIEMISRMVIKKKIFGAVKEAVIPKLKELDCEQYRP